MEIILEKMQLATDRPSDGYTTGGELYLRIGDSYFPEEHWYDCAYINLKKWIPALISFGRQHTDRCQLNFMDGPYSVQLSRKDNCSVDAQCFENHTCVNCLHGIDLTRLLKSAMISCRRYDRFLYENGYNALFQTETRKIKEILDT